MSIFTQTSCLKSELSNTILNLMTAAGWKNISTDETADFFVMHSKGESGDKDLVFQWRPTSTSNSGNVQTSSSVIMSYRLIGGYTPNASGAGAGVFNRASESWRAWNIAQSSVDVSVEMVIWYSINKDRAIFNIYAPDSLGLAPTFFYVGLPTVYTPESQSRGLVAVTTATAAHTNAIHVTDNVDGLPSLTSSTSNILYFTAPPKSPNSAGVHTPYEIMYGNATIGIRGKLDSLMFLPTGTINDGDILRMGSARYRATQAFANTTNSIGTNCIIYRIS